MLETACNERPNGETFVLTLAAQPSDVPAVIRLRRVIKALGRTYGFRCTAIRPAEPVLEPGKFAIASQPLRSVTAAAEAPQPAASTQLRTRRKKKRANPESYRESQPIQERPE